MTTQPNVHILPDEKTWVERVGQAIVDVLNTAIETQGQATMALSGGNTPRPVYAYLADLPAWKIRWSHVHLFWGDERYVPYNDPRSNYRMAMETFIEHVPIPPENVHPMPTYMRHADLAAKAYESTLRAFFKESAAFDLTLLGLGEDCHTASLFPHTPALHEQERWVVPNQGPDVERLTLTYPALNSSRRVFFLVKGGGKASTVQRVLQQALDIEECPAKGIQPRGELHWWLDADAAHLLQTEQER